LLLQLVGGPHRQLGCRCVSVGRGRLRHDAGEGGDGWRVAGLLCGLPSQLRQLRGSRARARTLAVSGLLACSSR